MYPLLAILGLQIIVATAITACIPIYYMLVEKLDEFVAKAHVPSHGYEWALKARNEKLQEWSSGATKPRSHEAKSSFGVVCLDAEYDYLGITAHPKASRGKPFCKDTEIVD